MAEVEETPLPGVGLRYDFTTRIGTRIGVISHRTGERDLLIYDTRDPDTCRATLPLSPADANVLIELLGGSQVTQRLTDLQQEIEGLVLGWLKLSATSPVAGRSLADSSVRAQTGASVVAVVRGETAVPVPGPEFHLEAGDVVVVVGTKDAIATAAEIFET